MDPTTRKFTPGVMVFMDLEDIRPILESPLSRDPSKCVVAYPREDSHYDVWLYARDSKTGNLGRCLAYRTYRKSTSEKWDLRYEIGDLDEKTRVSLLTQIQKALTP